MPSVFFLIRSLERGGAERQLSELVHGLLEDGFDVTVATFYDGGAMRQELARIPGIKLLSLGKRGRWDTVGFLWRLGRALHAAKPDIIHGYMSPANELAVIFSQLSRAKSVCGLRASDLDFAHYDALSRRMFQVGAWLSHFADAIVANSEAGRQHHVAHGYRASRMVVIPNGIDCDRFRPEPEVREPVRAAWGISAQETLVGLVARVDPMKDHPNFLRAAAEVMRRHPSARFVCVGHSVSPLKEELQRLAAQLGLTKKLIFAGARDDMSSVYNAIDIVVLCSAFGEGFPNVVAEAMAVGRPCVVTAVGDAAAVVGNTGRVVPPRDSAALAEAICGLLQLSTEERSALGAAARSRIVRQFSRRRLVDATEAVLSELVSRSRSKRASAQTAEKDPA